MTPWTVARQAPLQLGFPGQEYWSGLPFPSPGDLPGPVIKPVSPALEGRCFTAETPGKPQMLADPPVYLSSHLCAWPMAGLLKPQHY